MTTKDDALRNAREVHKTSLCILSALRTFKAVAEDRNFTLDVAMAVEANRAALATIDAALAVEGAADDDLWGCESCDKRFPLEAMVGAGDVHICSDCHAAWLKEYHACEHKWGAEPISDNHGDPVLFCPKCGGAKPVDGCPQPVAPDQHAGPTAAGQGEAVAAEPAPPPITDAQVEAALKALHGPFLGETWDSEIYPSVVEAMRLSMRAALEAAGSVG